MPEVDLNRHWPRQIDFAQKIQNCELWGCSAHVRMRNRTLSAINLLDFSARIFLTLTFELWVFYFESEKVPELGKATELECVIEIHVDSLRIMIDDSSKFMMTH